MLGTTRLQAAKDLDVIILVDAERSFVDASKSQEPLTDAWRALGRQPPDGEGSLHDSSPTDNPMDDKIAAAPVERRDALPADELNKLRAIARSRGLELAQALGVRIV